MRKRHSMLDILYLQAHSSMATQPFRPPHANFFNRTGRNRLTWLQLTKLVLSVFPRKTILRVTQTQRSLTRCWPFTSSDATGVADFPAAIFVNAFGFCKNKVTLNLWLIVILNVMSLSNLPELSVHEIGKQNWICYSRLRIYE